MSGVTGAGKITRARFEELVTEYTKELNKIGITDIKVSGSFVSNPTKKTFGDIDLIVTIPGNKKQTKKDLAQKLMKLKGIEPFSGKHAGKKYYNSSEIITIRYKGAQIDNIVATTSKEAEFKLKFLNLPAEIQGLVLGGIKAKLMGPRTGTVNEYTLSSSGLSLREVTLNRGKEVKGSRKVLKTWTDWNMVERLVKIDSFDKMLDNFKGLSYRQRGRIKGVFKSMISVKSGEVGKLKGYNKLKAIKRVDSVL